jgi:formate dehydrogenase
VRLRAVRAAHGPAAFATYTGNPASFAAATSIAADSMAKALDIKWKYNLNGEDAVSILAATEILYGNASGLTKPDFWHTSFALIVGANPVRSHGSIICEPIVAKALKSITDRGGRVVAVDPRRGETAQNFEHLPIRAGSDAYFLSALLRELIAQGYADKAFIERHTNGFEQLRDLLEPCTAEWAAGHSGIPAQTIRDLAQNLGSVIWTR